MLLYIRLRVVVTNLPRLLTMVCKLLIYFIPLAASQSISYSQKYLILAIMYIILQSRELTMLPSTISQLKTLQRYQNPLVEAKK